MSSHRGETWIEDEALAYNTYSGRPSGSGRRGRVRFPDGKLRIVRLGVPDTFFTIPAKPSRGCIGTVRVDDGPDGTGEFIFTSADWREEVPA